MTSISRFSAGWTVGACWPWWTPPGTSCPPYFPTGPSSSSPTPSSWARSSAGRWKRMRRSASAHRSCSGWGPGTCWSPWPGTAPCCWTRPAGITGWASRRARCAIPWARATPWWPASWPAGSRRAAMRPPTGWARRQGPPRRSRTVSPGNSKFCPCWTNFNKI